MHGTRRVPISGHLVERAWSGERGIERLTPSWENPPDERDQRRRIGAVEVDGIQGLPGHVG